jgi:uncharacterized protein
MPDVATSFTASTRPLAVVTGASSGIGRELSLTFADNGFDVVVAAENQQTADVATDVRSRGVLALPEQVDLATPEGVDQLVRSVRLTGRPVAAAAVNAGVGIGGRFHETDLDDDLRVIDLNVRSSVHLTKLLVRDMVQQGQGRILVTSSVAAATPGPYHATYAASKAFLHSFAEALRFELKDAGVTVTSLMPGPTDTDFFDRAQMHDTKVATGAKDDPAEVARQGFDALMNGKDHVVAGATMNRAQVTGATVVSDPVGAAVASRMTKPGSGKS